jgi:hypothetical protein
MKALITVTSVSTKKKLHGNPTNTSLTNKRNDPATAEEMITNAV